jgi:hypothetical protein
MAKLYLLGGEELKSLSEKVKMKTYAIPERCALIYDDGRLQFIGEAHLFYNGEKSRCE